MMGFWRFVHKRYYVTHYLFGVQPISCQSWTKCFVNLIGNCLKVVLYHGMLPMYLFSGRYGGYTTQSCTQISCIIYQLYGTIKGVTSCKCFLWLGKTCFGQPYVDDLFSHEIILPKICNLRWELPTFYFNDFILSVIGNFVMREIFRWRSMLLSLQQSTFRSLALHGRTLRFCYFWMSPILISNIVECVLSSFLWDGRWSLSFCHQWAFVCPTIQSDML